MGYSTTTGHEKFVWTKTLSAIHCWDRVNSAFDTKMTHVLIVNIFKVMSDSCGERKGHSGGNHGPE